MKYLPILLIGLCLNYPYFLKGEPMDEDGSRLWLRYNPLPHEYSSQYAESLQTIHLLSPDDRINNAAMELTEGLSGLLGSISRWLRKRAPRNQLFWGH